MKRNGSELIIVRRMSRVGQIFILEICKLGMI